MLSITNDKEMQINSTMRYYLTPARMVTIKNTMISFGEDVRETKASSTVGGVVNWCSHYGKQCRGSSKS